MIGIIDYGMGNLRSVQMGFARVGVETQLLRTPAELANASKIVLPGVGACADAIAHLRERGLDEPIVRAIEGGRPFLGICLGLQMLFDVSYEDGQHTGLGVLAGKVVRFNFDHLPSANRPAIPHMGWNQIHWAEPIAMLDGVPQSSYMYFVHSYYVEPLAEVTRVTTDYGGEFVSAVARDNLFATQFHPEKSQAIGLKILENFAKL